MSKNSQHFTIAILLLVTSSVCFAQTETIEPKPAGHFGQQRKLMNWWDEPTVVSTLKLETEQLAKLSKLQEDFSQASKANSEKLKEQNKSLGAAILTADDKKVADIKKDIVGLASAKAKMQTEFKIAGLGLLNKQQLAELATRYPDVIGKKWSIRTKGMTRSKGNNKGARNAKRAKNKKQRNLEAETGKSSNEADKK